MNNERDIDPNEPNKRRLSLGATIRIAQASFERLYGDSHPSSDATVTQLPLTPEQESRSHHPTSRGDADQPRLSGKEMIAKLEAEHKIPTELHSVEDVDSDD
ncbi:MAG: hypothetical protein EOO17_01175 [Chloroflexi bacterium]|nr:MAG: hypothetical protein EOO17_01175 [Chloroflexota bacterium]